MEITGATFNFTKTVNGGSGGGGSGNRATPEHPVDEGSGKPAFPGDNMPEEPDLKGAFVFDTIKKGVQNTMSALLSNVSGSPTLQVQLQAAQKIGGKIIAYGAAALTQNWVALTTMVIADLTTAFFDNANLTRDKAWATYSQEQYAERRGYSTARNRK